MLRHLQRLKLEETFKAVCQYFCFQILFHTIISSTRLFRPIHRNNHEGKEREREK